MTTSCPANARDETALPRYAQAWSERTPSRGRAEGEPLLQAFNADLEKSRRELMESLKVPRWPAANPCL
ncbi:MAG: hypothetical protein JSS04_13290 [Proteobacteria bacterium]|nr:hypothetical protein [Pseudomonadota bacterium]